MATTITRAADNVATTCKRALAAARQTRPESSLTVSLMLTLALTASCVAPSDQYGPETEIVELTELAWGVVNGERVALPLVEGNRLVIEETGAIDLFLRLPEKSRLIVGMPTTHTSEDLDVELRTDSQVRTLTGRQTETEWQASLEDVGDEPVCLRLINRSSRPLVLTSARVEGVKSQTAPILQVGPVLTQRPLNIVFYLIDTLRADHLSLYGYSRNTSPRMDRLAEDAIVFTNAYAPGSYTLPSLSALFASQMPSALGGRLLSDEGADETLAESFAKAGYTTAAFQANTLVDFLHNDFRRGFDHWQGYPRKRTEIGNEFVQAPTLHKDALEWLEKHTTDKFFLFIQSMDVHGSQPAPPEFEDMFRNDPLPAMPESLSHKGPLKPVTDSYDGRIAFQDAEIAKLLDRIRAMDLAHETAVIITSDHGEPLGERGWIRHGHTIYEELVHIPLIMLLPGEGPQTVADIVSLVDVGPTIMEIAGVPVPDGIFGRSMLVPRRGDDPPTAYGELMKPKAHTAQGWYARQGPWKLLISATAEQLFHLPTDPTEDVDRSGEHPVTAGYLATQAWKHSPARNETTGGKGPRSDEEIRSLEAELRAMGYID